MDGSVGRINDSRWLKQSYAHNVVHEMTDSINLKFAFKNKLFLLYYYFNSNIKFKQKTNNFITPVYFIALLWNLHN